MNDSQFGNHWESIYSRGEQLNRYPYDSVVSFVFQYRNRELVREDTKILEVGCGAGNNIWFAAREGFDVYGLDGSASAIDYARKRFDSEAIKADLQVGDFTKLSYEAGHFDMVIDRAAITCVNFDDAAQATKEVYRVLKPKGKFYAFIFSTDHASYTDEDSDGNGYIANIKNGTMKTVKASCYYDESRLKKLFTDDRWKCLSQRKVIDTDIVDASRETVAYWILVLEKI